MDHPAAPGLPATALVPTPVDLGEAPMDLDLLPALVSETAASVVRPREEHLTTTSPPLPALFPPSRPDKEALAPLPTAMASAPREDPLEVSLATATDLAAEEATDSLLVARLDHRAMDLVETTMEALPDFQAAPDLAAVSQEAAEARQAPLLTASEETATLDQLAPPATDFQAAVDRLAPTTDFLAAVDHQPLLLPLIIQLGLLDSNLDPLETMDLRAAEAEAELHFLVLVSALAPPLVLAPAQAQLLE